MNMKLDGQLVLFHGNIDHKSDSKLFGYNDITLDSIVFKSENGIMNEDQYAALSNMNSKERNADRLKYAVNDEDGQGASKLDYSMRTDISKTDNEKEVGGFIAPTSLTHPSLKTESFDKDTVFYVDKSVMESELPELVVCYKENTYHVVKDICIDEGVPLQDRFLFDPGVSEDNLCLILPPKDIDFEIAKERVDLNMSIPDDLKLSAEKEKSAYLTIPDVLISSEEKISKNEVSLDYDSKKLTPIGEAEVGSKEETSNVPSEEIFSLGELLSMPEVGRELSQPESAHDSIDETELQSIQRSYESTITAMASASEESESGNEPESLVNPVVHVAEESNFSHQETVSGALALDSAAKADQGNDETGLLDNDLNSATEVSENGSGGGNMANRSGVSVPESSSSKPKSAGEEDYQNCGSEHIETCLSGTDEANFVPFTSQFQTNLGETSFSAAGPLSGLISYSGPIANSGSVSLRSDSSTTSTRSFAFPILQAEWNGSPVRMVKADRKHNRKHRNWRQGLLCCRF